MAARYVSPFGEDSNSGTTPTDPWRTISHALASLSSGDTLNVYSGFYDETAATSLVFATTNMTVVAYENPAWVLWAERASTPAVYIYAKGFDITASGVTLQDIAFDWPDAVSPRFPFGKVLANNCTLRHFVVDMQYNDKGGIQVGDATTNVTGFVADRVWCRNFVRLASVYDAFGIQLFNTTGAVITNYVGQLIDGAALQFEPQSSGTTVAFASWVSVNNFIKLRGDATRATHDNAIHNCAGADTYDAVFNKDWGAFGAGSANTADLVMQDSAPVTSGVAGGLTVTNETDVWVEFIGTGGFPGSDLHVDSTSPVRGAASDEGVTVDFDGRARPSGGGFDIGAYQYTAVDYRSTPPAASSPAGTNRRIGLYGDTLRLDPQNITFSPFDPGFFSNGFMASQYALAAGEVLVGAQHVADAALPSIADASVSSNRLYNPSNPNRGYDFQVPVTVVTDPGFNAGVYLQGHYHATSAAEVRLLLYKLNGDGTTTLRGSSPAITVPPGAPRAFYRETLVATASTTLEPGSYLLGVFAIDDGTSGGCIVYGAQAPVNWATNSKPADASGYTGSGGSGGSVQIDTTSLPGITYVTYSATCVTGNSIVIESPPVPVVPEEPLRQILCFIDFNSLGTASSSGTNRKIGLRFYNSSMTLLSEQVLGGGASSIEGFPPAGTAFVSAIVRTIAASNGVAAVAMRQIVFAGQEEVANLLAFFGSIGSNVKHYVDGDNAEMFWAGAAQFSRSLSAWRLPSIGVTSTPPSTIEGAGTPSEISFTTSGHILTRPAVFLDVSPTPALPLPSHDGLETVCFTDIEDKPIIDNDPTSTTSVYTFDVVDERIVEFVDVTWYFSHTFAGDVKITLTAPNSASVDVAIGNDTNYGSGDGTGMGIGVTAGQQCHVTDDAPGGLHLADDTTGNWTGDFLPDNPLAPLNGQPATGTWTLTFVDIAGGDSGTVHLARVCLSFAASPPGPPPAIIPPYKAPFETEDYYARLPFHEAQSVFRSTEKRPEPRRATVGWHVTRFEPTTWYCAVARADGPFADLVGERVEVLADGADKRSIVVYIRDALPLDAGEDLSLTRRAYLAIDPLWTETVTATVTPMA